MQQPTQDEATSFRIPRKLDAPPKFLWWDMDIALIGLFGLGFGVISGYLIQSILCGIAVATLVNKAKSGKRAGYSAHMAYWFFGMRIFKKRTPESHVRDFIG